jgi:AhpD family alkylhydroperoxidase
MDLSRDLDAEPGLAEIRRHYGEFIDRWVDYSWDLYGTSGLDEKTKELIVTALLALRGWETGVRVHTRLALAAGATPAEIRGAILVTMAVGGMKPAAEGLAWAATVAEAETAAQ